MSFDAQHKNPVQPRLHRLPELLMRAVTLAVSLPLALLVAAYVSRRWLISRWRSGGTASQGSAIFSQRIVPWQRQRVDGTSGTPQEKPTQAI